MQENRNEKIYKEKDEEAKKVEDAVKSSVLNIMQHTSLFKIPEENLRATSHAFEILKVAEFSNTILALIGFSCAAISSDIEYTSSMESGWVFQLVLLVGTISTLMLILSIIWRTHCILEWEKGRGLYSSFDNIQSSGKLKTLILELIINFLHPIWPLRNVHFLSFNTVFKVYIKYAYNDLLTICTILRIYHIINLYSVFSKYRTERSFRICKMNGNFAGTTWAVKCLMNDDPLKVVIALMVIGILIGGFCLRIFERPLNVYSELDFSYYGNTMWCVLLTMTTVGYGDYYPSTLPGRIVGLIICIWGVLVVSIMVLTVTNMLKLSSDEIKALSLYRRLNFREELRDAAGKLLFSAFQYKKISRDFEDDDKVKAHYLSKVQRSLKEYQRIKLQKKILYNLNSTEDNIDRRINHIITISKTYNDKLDNLKTGIESLLE
ncbi:hypothetical protein SteCoe_31976 [Stentor coeruleus]|uniref:Potassium channel domain-containing protein n=1 Tax=Stentor coeruleus TaxID=5963 RepID=A0A1R2B038_9CILI|nr:hypothetical protein SteCoe_31976 [Stentor coeruleus]